MIGMKRGRHVALLFDSRVDDIQGPVICMQVTLLFEPHQITLYVRPNLVLMYNTVKLPESNIPHEIKKVKGRKGMLVHLPESLS
jgi:hypothetical protein